MLRDDRAGGEGRRQAARNVLGEALEICSFRPMTGFYRDGCCNTGREGMGSHTVCAVMTSEFLKFSKSCGNDLSTPLPEFGFPGLNLATAGAYVLPAGRKHLRQTRRLASFCVPRTRAL